MTATPAASNQAATPGPQRIPPQNLDAEMALIGSMMMSRDAISDVIPVLARGDGTCFYLPVHQKLFEVLLDLYDDPSKAIDLVVVSEELKRRDLLEFVGGHDYMIQLAESFADWANAEHYARIVRDKGMLRDLIRCAGQIADDAYTGLDDAREILDLAEQKIFAVTERRVARQAARIGVAVTQLAKQLEPDQRGVYTGVRTGFTVLDEYTGGFQLGDLIVLAGRPSMGKTALGLAMALHMALEDKRPVVFFSMEMSSDQVAHRLVSAHTGIDSQKLRRRILSQGEVKGILDACNDFENAPLFIDDSPGLTAMELRSSARRLKQKHDIQAVFVDYLQLMHLPKSESRQAEIASISRGLKALGRELDIPVIAMSQLNRQPEGRQDKRPIMSDLRESGAIEQDADVVLLIHREEYYKPEDEDAKGKAELIIAKQRNGPVGTVRLSFNSKITRFADLSIVREPVGATYGHDAPF